MEIILNNINRLNTIEPDIWRNILETDYQGVENSLILREDYFKVVSSIAPIIRSVIFEQNEWQNHEEIPATLPDQFKISIKTLGVLKEFSSRINKEIVFEYLREELEENNLLEVLQAAGEQKRVLLNLLLVNELSVELLQQLLLISRYDKYGYQDYVLLMDLDNIGDPRRQAELRAVEAHGITNPVITTEIVNRILRNYELNNTTGLNSLCLKVTTYNNEFVVFILRESQRGGLRTFQEFIVGMNADLLVLRFNRNLKELKVRAVETVKEEVYQTISNEIVSSIDQTLTPKYIKSSASNSNTVITRFIQALLNEEINNVTLHSLEIANCPLPGRPNMSFVKTSEHISLSESLGYQGEEQNFLTDLISQSDINKVKVSFLSNRKIHIFGFKLRKIGEVTYVFISGQGGGVRKRKLLIDLLSNETGIRILESKE